MRQLLKLSVLTAICSLATMASAETRVIGYVPSWAQYTQFYAKDVQYNFLTHIHYGYMLPDASGAIAISDAGAQVNYEEQVKLAKEHGVKIVVSVGGPGNAEAMKAASADAVRATFVKNIVGLVKKDRLDGIEIDWLPEATDKGIYASLLKELAQAFAQESPKPILTATLPWSEDAAAGIDPDALAGCDYVTVQAMDLMDDSKTTLEPNTNISVTTKALSMWEGKGVPADKLVPVVPFYGRSFKGAKGLGTTFTGVGSGNEGVLNYKDLMEKFDGPAYKVTFDDASQSEVAVSADETIIFSGIPSVKAVATLVKGKNYGGVAAYDLSGDYPQWKVSLLVTIGHVLRPSIDYKAKQK